MKKIPLKDVLIRIQIACKDLLLDRYADELDMAVKYDEEDFKRSLKAIQALSNELRLLVLVITSLREFPVCILSSMLKKDQTLLSHHLKILKEAGLLKESVEGRFRFYQLNKEKIDEIIEFLEKLKDPQNWWTKELE